MDCIIETANGARNYYQFLRKTLQFLIPVSIFSFFVSYFSGFPFFFFFRNLQLSTLIFPLVAQALDRKCMFLICNGILAFLAKNLKLTGTSSGLNYGDFMKITEDGVKQIQELPQILLGAAVQENAASMEYVDSPLNVAVPAEKQTALQQEQDYDGSQKEAEEIKTGGLILDSEDWEEEEEEELEESRGLEGTPLKEEVSDAGVSTEELNKKFEEFIRRMKEEIRIEARNTIIAV